MSILREDFSVFQVAGIERAAEAVGVSFSAAVRMLIDYGLNARSGIGGVAPGYQGGSTLPGISLPPQPSPSSSPEVPPSSPLDPSSTTPLPSSSPTPKTPSYISPAGSAAPAPAAPVAPRKPRTRRNPVEPPAFTEFYDEVYPRKEGRREALSAWLRAEKEGTLPTLDQLRAVIAQQVDERDWANPEKRQFIPHPSSWINGKRWTDKPLRGPVVIPKPQPDPDPAAEAEAARERRRHDAQEAYRLNLLQILHADDGWRTSSKTWAYEGLDRLQEPEEFEARLDHVRSLVDRLRALGALPLRVNPAAAMDDTLSGLIWPACAMGPWRPTWVEGRGVVLPEVEANDDNLQWAMGASYDGTATRGEISAYLDDFTAGFERGPVGSPEFAEGRRAAPKNCPGASSIASTPWHQSRISFDCRTGTTPVRTTSKIRR